MSVVCRSGALKYLFLISSSSDAHPGLGICGLEDLSFLTVIQLSIVVVGAQVVYVIAVNVKNLQSRRAI